MWTVVTVQVFKYEFSCVISEMAFQCTKLSELFSREPLVETFKLETEDSKLTHVFTWRLQALFSNKQQFVFRSERIA